MCMSPVRIFAGMVLAGLLAQSAGGSSWNKIRYQGGTVEARVNPFDWNTTLTLKPDGLELLFAGRKRLSIPRAEIGTVAYGSRAFRRVADTSLLLPLSLFGVLYKSKDHMVSIEFKTADGKNGAVLLMVHKDHVQGLLQALKLFTGRPVENWP